MALEEYLQKESFDSLDTTVVRKKFLWQPYSGLLIDILFGCFCIARQVLNRAGLYILMTNGTSFLVFWSNFFVSKTVAAYFR